MVSYLRPYFGGQYRKEWAFWWNGLSVFGMVTPPVITGAPTTPANGYGWYKTNVVVHFEASDPVSGVAPSLDWQPAGHIADLPALVD